MKSKGNLIGVGVTILIALVILSVSFLKIATPNIAYSPIFLKSNSNVSVVREPVNYLLAYPGKIGPDSPLWYGKALRDRILYGLTFSNSKKKELNLLFADKRLSLAVLLFQDNKPDLGLSTLMKAEKYLEKAIPETANDVEYLKKLALASLKHREVIEYQILPLSPEDIAPQVNKINDYPKETYKKARDLIYSKGLVPPEDVFELK